MKTHLIVVLSDGETWEVLGPDSAIMLVNDEQLEEMKRGAKPVDMAAQTVALADWVFNEETSKDA